MHTYTNLHTHTIYTNTSYAYTTPTLYINIYTHTHYVYTILYTHMHYIHTHIHTIYINTYYTHTSASLAYTFFPREKLVLFLLMVPLAQNSKPGQAISEETASDAG